MKTDDGLGSYISRPSLDWEQHYRSRNNHSTAAYGRLHPLGTIFPHNNDNPDRNERNCHYLQDSPQSSTHLKEGMQ